MFRNAEKKEKFKKIVEMFTKNPNDPENSGNV
jgi:hypothetical protein